MENTTSFGFDFLDYYHIHKDIITNRNFKILDTILCNHLLLSRTKNSPRNNPSIGDMYLVPEINDQHSNNDGEIEKNWENKNGSITCYIGDGEWHFIKPKNGMIFFILDEDQLCIYIDSSWKTLLGVDIK